VNKDPHFLQSRWQEIENQFHEVVDCLQRESRFATGRLKVRVARVIEFLGSQPERDAVLANRDALSMLLPLLTSQNNSESVESLVRKGVRRIAGNDVYRRNWLQLFWYPALVMIVAFFVCVFLSFAVAPKFEATLLGMGLSMDFSFDDGRRLPWLTRLSFAVASFLRTLWIPIVVLGFAAAIGIWWINKWGRRNNPSGLGWFDDQNISVRAALAIWSGHLAGLLEIGVSQTEAFEIASRDTPKRSLRNLSSALASRDRVTGANEQRPYLPLRKYAMLDYALKETTLPAKVVALEEVSRYYRDRDRYVSTWWMAWVSSAMLWMIGLSVFGVAIAFFSPLRDMITGLTGLTVN